MRRRTRHAHRARHRERRRLVHRAPTIVTKLRKHADALFDCAVAAAVEAAAAAAPDALGRHRRRRHLNGDDGTAARPEWRAALRRIDGRLDVVRVVVAPAHHQHVLEPPHHVQHAAVQEAEVARRHTHLGPAPALAPAPPDGAVLRRRRHAAVGPVSARHRAAAHLDLSDGAVGQWLPRRLGAHDGDAELRAHGAPRHLERRPLALVAVWRCAPPRARLEARAVDAQQCWRLREAGHVADRLGEAVRAAPRALVEAARRKGGSEGAERLWPYRFRAVEAEEEVAELELGSLRRRRLLERELVPKVGRARVDVMRAVHARDGMQPARGSLQERDRRHHLDA